MNGTDWYEVVEGPVVLQGDILPSCPVFQVAADLKWPVSDPTGVRLNATVTDLVVMTQSCDLVNSKVEEVLLAQRMAWSDLVHVQTQGGNDVVKSSRFRKLLVEGNIFSLLLLHKRDTAPELPWSVVDFHRVFTLPKAFVTQFAALVGPRLRLRSPYREHLAQAFARYFMRVGLPHDAKAFEKEGDVQV